jgi:hypothetical protein
MIKCFLERLDSASVFTHWREQQETSKNQMPSPPPRATTSTAINSAVFKRYFSLPRFE